MSPVLSILSSVVDIHSRMSNRSSHQTILASRAAGYSIGEHQGPGGATEQPRHSQGEHLLFWWVVGYEASVGGARKRVSQIVFPHLPPMTEADLDRGRDWANWLYQRWGLE